MFGIGMPELIIIGVMLAISTPAVIIALRSPPAKKVFFAEVMTTPVMCVSPGAMFVPSRNWNATWFGAAAGTSAMRGWLCAAQ